MDSILLWLIWLYFALLFVCVCVPQCVLVEIETQIEGERNGGMV